MNINSVSLQDGEVTQYQSPTKKQSANMQDNVGNTETTRNENGAQALVEAIEKANHIEKGNTECQFSIHEKTNQIMIKIVDQTTKQVIKEIPSEQILDMIAKMCDLVGVFVDEKR